MCTPLSNKDFTKEFTTRIHERCQFGQITYQKAATVLDPTSGKISTILTTADCTAEQQSPTLTFTANASPAKKPSYLNLACCVNGYSNLTTYDSKFRQNINKSREVSPIRPITHTLQYNRGDGNYLVVPVPVPLKKDTQPSMEHPVLSPDKRFYASPKRQTTDTGKCTAMDQDCTDNATAFYKTKLHSPSLALTNSTNGSDSSPKSFIQQRVERLYGPGALAQGFYSPVRTRNNASILSERSQNADSTPSPKQFKSDARPNGQNVPEKTCAYGGDELENVNVIDEQSLPVLRHLRPEFRAQLPMLSPKRATSKLSSEFVKSNNSTSQTNNILSSSAATAVASTLSLPAMHTSGNTTAVSSSSSPSTNKNHLLANEFNGLSVVNDCSPSNFINGFLSEAVSSVNNMTLSENIIKNGCGNGHSNGVGNSVIEQKSLSVIEDNSVKNGQTNKNAVGKVNTMNNNRCKNSNNNCIVVTNGNIKMADNKDGNYFINIIKVERDRLLDLALATENDLETLLQVIRILFHKYSILNAVCTVHSSRDNFHFHFIISK